MDTLVDLHKAENDDPRLARNRLLEALRHRELGLESMKLNSSGDFEKVRLIDSLLVDLRNNIAEMQGGRKMKLINRRLVGRHINPETKRS